MTRDHSPAVSRNFQRWILDLRAALRSDYGFMGESAESYGSDEDWRVHFDHGDDPYQAIEEDLSYADPE